MRIIDANTAKISYAGPSDMRLGLMIKNKLYLGAKGEVEAGGETFRESLSGELYYHLSKYRTLGAAIERTEYHGPGDVIATDPEGWNFNFGFFGAF